jgi:hypothetical protein
MEDICQGVAENHPRVRLQEGGGRIPRSAGRLEFRTRSLNLDVKNVVEVVFSIAAVCQYCP